MQNNTPDVPYNSDAEEAVICACLLSETALYTALEFCSDSHFYIGINRTIFKAIQVLAEKNMGIDVTTVADQLSDGGGAILKNIADNKKISASHIEEYCAILSEYSKLRTALEASHSIQTKISFKQGKADDIIEKAQEALFNAYQDRKKEMFVTPNDILDGVYATINAKIGGDADTVSGLSTSLKKLDTVLHGLEPQDFIILAGRPSMGKTELALQISIHNCLKGVGVAWFSIEQPRQDLMERVISNITEISLSKLKKGWLNKQEVQRLEEQQLLIQHMPLFIDDSPSVTILHLTAKARRLKQQFDTLGLIVIDYLQLMDIPYGANRAQEISRVSRALKILARSLDIPVIALSQLSRKCEDREDKRPMLADLRESGGLEQDADKIIFMYSDYPYIKKVEKTDADKYKGEIIVGKHRNGPIGDMDITNNKCIQKIYNREDLDPEQIGYHEILNNEEDFVF